MAVNIDNRLFLEHARINPENQHRLRHSLSGNSTLNKIKLAGGAYTDLVVDDICAFIEQNCTLHELEFCEENFTDAGVSKMFRSLCSNTSIKHLNLQRCPLTDFIIRDLCLVLAQNDTLETLQFKKARFTDYGLSQILRSLSRNTTILSLALWESQLSDQVVQDMCMFLDANNVVKELMLFKACFTDSGLSILLPGLERNSHLKQLVLLNSPLTDDVVPDMCYFLDQNKSLEAICFENAAFSNHALSRMLESLSTNSTLEMLSFARSDLSDDVVGDMCHFIEYNRVAKCLNFNASKFTDAGLSTLLQALTNNVTLETLAFDNSQLSDVAVLPLCRFLIKNSVIKQNVFSSARFTDNGFTLLLQGFMQNSTVESIIFPESSLTDGIIPALVTFSKENNVLEHIVFCQALFTDHELEDMLQFLSQNMVLTTIVFDNNALYCPDGLAIVQYLKTTDVLTSMIVTQPIGDVQSLIRFISQRVHMTELRSQSRGTTPRIKVNYGRAEESDIYYIRTVKYPTEFLSRSEYLQSELMDLLKRHSIPSAVDLVNNLLVLFVHKEKAGFKQALDEKLQNLDEDVVTACRIHVLDQATNVVLENDNEQWKSGLWVYSPDIGETATVGAILVDDEGKLYLTSTFHGKTIGKCQILNRFDGQCVAEVYSMSPLLDACLIEVRDPEGKIHCELTLPAPHVDAALCGPYTGPNMHLARDFKARTSRTANTTTAVNKYGIRTYLTEGRLFYYNFTYPNIGITDALLVVSGYGENFTEGGDCGAVIFRHSPCPDTHTATVFCHEAIAVNCGGLTLGSQKLSVTCRLDDVIKHFESKLGKKLKLVGMRSNTLEDHLFRLKLGMVISDEEPLE